MHNDILHYNNTKSKQSNILVDYKGVCERIKNIFVIERLSKSIPLMDLCLKIKSNLLDESKLKLNIINLDDIYKIIKELTELVPDWIKIINHSLLGELVKIDLAPNIRDIVNKLEIALKLKYPKELNQSEKIMIS